MATGNPLADRRRQRKVENQRLEEAARQRREELRKQQEAERQRLQDEQLAEEQRRLQEQEEIRRKKEAEEERIASLEREEKQVITNIEKQLRLVGTFWTSTLELPHDGNKALLLCAAVLSPKALEKSIQGVEDDIIFVGDSIGKLHSYDRKTRTRLFSASWDEDELNGVALRVSSAITTTRCGRLLVCDQDCAGVAIIDLRLLFQLYRTALLSLHAKGGNSVDFDASTARVAFIGGNSQLTLPRGLAMDDSAGEFYVSDETSNCIRVFKLPAGAAVSKRGGFDRSIGAAPPKAILKRPGGLDLSHYHVVVCDNGNSRVAVFAKRGTFVLAVGSKGVQAGEFHDIRDVKLANVRKRAITRGLPSENEGSGIWSEQFEAIVADCGNFRVQLLNERGEFLRQLSLLGSVEQVSFQRTQFSRLRAELEREYAALRRPPPILSGKSMTDIYGLATAVHPSCRLYSTLTGIQMEWRNKRSRFHHPFALAYANAEKEIVVVDRENACTYTYGFDAAERNWLQLPMSKKQGDGSVHSSVQITFTLSSSTDIGQETKATPKSRWLYVSDPLKHRVAVFDTNDMALKFFIGAATYGDQELSAGGYLPGELNSPSFLAVYNCGGGRNVDETKAMRSHPMLVVSDVGNHSISLFDARNGSFCGRIGEGLGHLEGYFDSPQGVAVLDDRLLFVCDQHNHRVQVFDLESRQFVRSFGQLGMAPGEFNFPTGLAVCSALPEVPECDFGPHRNAKIVVADTGNHRVQVFTLDGCVQIVVDAEATPFDQPLSPIGVWVEQRSGYVLVSDVANRCVAVFTNCGEYVSSFGATGEVDSRFIQPSGVVIVQQYAGIDLLLVTDAGHCDVTTFQLRL